MMVNLTCEEDSETTMDDDTTNCLGENEQEDKVRVDRRKLEQMLQVNGVEGDGISAEYFFTKVMNETCTTISWPSKLKIGAKSKKDPHIKIIGIPENIKKAKEMVIAVLESKANRVTLKMDVSHTDHSHIIGRRGQSIKKVMEETGCHIHFPDSNRGSTTTEKSNQVSIAGQPEGVEKARARIRELLPLVLIFEVPFNNGYLPFDPNTPAIQSIAQTYDVAFMTKGRSQMGSLIIVLRANPNNLLNIQQAIGCLYQHLTGRYQIPHVVSLQFDIAPQHHVFVLGRSGSNIKQIIEITGAKIDFPDPSSMSSRKGTVVISGSIHAVVQARSMLLQSLPMLLMFDLKENEAIFVEQEPDKLKKLMDKFCVTIMVKPKPRQTSKSVVIKSMESNAQNMYLTRLEIFGNPMDPNKTHHPASPTASSTNTTESTTSLSSWYSVVTQPLYNQSATTPLRSTLSQAPPAPLRQPPPGFEQRKSGSFNNGDFSVYSNETSTTRSHGTSSEENSPKHSIDYKYLRRNSEPTPPLSDCWQQQRPAIRLDMSNGARSLSSSTSNQSFSFTKTTDTSPVGSNLIGSHGQSDTSSLNTSASLSFNFDRFLSLQPQSRFLNYEEQSDKAEELLRKDKIIQHQIRTPTDQWSGLLLSKSSPPNVLKNQARQDPLLGIPTQSSKNDKSVMNSRQDFSASVKYPLAYLKRQNAVPGLPKENTFSPKDATLYNILKLYDVQSYAQKLEELEIDFATFITLTKDDLIEAGIEPLGARKKMEHAIKDMKDLQDRAVENDIQKRAFNFNVGNPLEFNSRSGRW